MDNMKIRPDSTSAIATGQAINPVAGDLQTRHEQLRQQLIQAILQQSESRSLGSGWTTVLASGELIRLGRGFGSPRLRALYVYDPAPGTGETVHLVIDVHADTGYGGSYGLDTNRDNPVFSTDALLSLLQALEADELVVDAESSCQGW